MRRKRKVVRLNQEPGNAIPSFGRYRNLKNPLVKQNSLSEEKLAEVHDAALKVLKDLGIKVLNDEARKYYRKAGAKVCETTLMVKLERDLVEKSLKSAPNLFTLYGAVAEKDIILGGNNLVFCPVMGPPFVSDIDRGKKVATLKDTENFIKLSEYFDIIHVQSTNVESQDIPTNERHLKVTESQLLLSQKPVCIYSRGQQQVQDAFEMIRISRGLGKKEFQEKAWCYTSINTNSPRQLDIPMCQGIIDFAKERQMIIITPFTLAGAMAPVTLSGALMLQHAEALAGIVLAQIVGPGTPVVYGSFTSNVHMKSGAPVFGTPEFVNAAFGAGQLARLVDLPWRGSAATTSNAPDGQSIYETYMSSWGTILGGANFMMHSAGWLEGGLTGSLEKFIIDIEMLQMFAEIFRWHESGDTDVAFDAIADVEPGGHFFGCQHTLDRYKDAFYEPLISDWNNFGTWTEQGSKTVTVRANEKWKQILREFQPPKIDDAVNDNLKEFVARRIREGGAPPVS